MVAQPQEPASLSSEARAHQQKMLMQQSGGSQAMAAPAIGAVQNTEGGGNIMNILLILGVLGFIVAIGVMAYFIVAG